MAISTYSQASLRVVFAVLAVLCLSAGRSWAMDPEGLALERAGIGCEDAKVIAYLLKRSDILANVDSIPNLIRQLGDRDFAKRQDASATLLIIGIDALPALRKACNDDDQEIAHRAQTCTTTIEKHSRQSLPLAAVRRLIRRQPEGVTTALLQYLPFADDDPVEVAIYLCLCSAQPLAAEVKREPTKPQAA